MLHIMEDLCSSSGVTGQLAAGCWPQAGVSVGGGVWMAVQHAAGGGGGAHRQGQGWELSWTLFQLWLRQQSSFSGELSGSPGPFGRLGGSSAGLLCHRLDSCPRSCDQSTAVAGQKDSGCLSLQNQGVPLGQVTGSHGDWTGQRVPSMRELVL